MIFKTLVVQGERRGYAVALIPGNASLSLRNAVALIPGNASLSLRKTALDDKRVELIAVEDIERITGYIKGGVSPFGLKRSMPAFVDSAVFHYPTVSVSAGQRGMQILLAPAHLVDAAQATVEQLTDE